MYNKDSDTILEGFGLTIEKQTELAKKYFKGSRAEVIASIVDSEELEQNEKYALMIEFGSRLVIDETTLIAEEHEKFLRDGEQGDTGEEN